MDQMGKVGGSINIHFSREDWGKHAPNVLRITSAGSAPGYPEYGAH